MAEDKNRSLLGVFSAIYDDLLRHLKSRFGDHVDANDVLQDAYLRLSRIPDDTLVENPRPYLYRVADNLARDHLRGQTSRNRRFTGSDALDTSASPAPSPEHEIDFKQRLQKLQEAVNELPPRQKQIFLLHKFEGLSHSEIASRLGISRSAVEKHMIKALIVCRDRLGDLMDPH